jgi:hypothetical protein
LRLLNFNNNNMKKLITLILIACSLNGFSQVYKTVTMALDTPTNVAKLRAGTQTYNLTDTFANYTPLQDGLISGGSATIGTGSVTIDTAYYRINKVNHVSLPRTFTGISNSASGTQYYILVYGKSDNTLDTLQGVQDTIATVPTKPNGTVSINTILVGDGGVVSSIPDLSVFFPLELSISGNANDKTNIAGKGQPLSNAAGVLDEYAYGPFMSFGNTGYVAQFNANYSTGKLSFRTSNNSVFSSWQEIPTGGGGSGTVTSITPAFGFTSTTPITTTGNLTIDSGVVRTVANSFTKAETNTQIASAVSGKENALTFGYGLTRASNTITADTTSGTGLVSKTRLTGALASKLNTNGSGASLTNVVNSITGTTNQVTASASTGAVTLSLPQSINTTATPQFARIGLGGAASASTTLLTTAGTTSVSSFRMPNGVAPTTPISGDWWSLTTGLRTQTYDGTQTKDVIFDKVNNVFAGFGVGAIVTDNSGNLSVAPAADRTLSNKLSKTANYTVTLSDFGANGELVLEVDCTGGAVTITLPSLANMAGVKLMVFKVDSGINAVTISGAVNINGSSTASLATQWSSLAITGGTSVYLAR